MLDLGLARTALVFADYKDFDMDVAVHDREGVLTYYGIQQSSGAETERNVIRYVSLRRQLQMISKCPITGPHHLLLFLVS